MKIIFRGNSLILTPLSKFGRAAAFDIKKSQLSKKTVPVYKFGRMIMSTVDDRYWVGGFLSRLVLSKGLLREVVNIINKHMSVKLIKTQNSEPNNGDVVGFKYIDQRVPLPHQAKYIASWDINKTGNLLVPIKPGKGKTFIGGAIVAKTNKRLLVVVLSKYMDKWESDLNDMFELEPDDVLHVNGAKQLITLIKTPRDELPKVIIIATRTLYNWFSNYETGKPISVPVNPEDFASHLGLGMLLLDEAHNEYHVIHKCINYFDLKSLALSGTFNSRSKYVKKYMACDFPPTERNDHVKYKPYKDFLYVSYSLPLNDEEKEYINPISGYSQNNYENIITGYRRDWKWNLLPPVRESRMVDGEITTVTRYKLHNKARHDYFNAMIIDYYARFLKSSKPNDKVIIYNRLIATCNTVVKALQEAYPNKKISRYTQDDDFKVVAANDVIVSTVLSSGEAFDIANLKSVFILANFASENDNEQAVGRLRERPDGVEAVLFSNTEVDKHMSYRNNRIALFKNDAKSVKFETYKPL